MKAQEIRDITDILYKEYRLGNIINPKYEDRDVYCDIYQINMDGEIILRDMNHHVFSMHLIDTKPIPLTEEWLLKFGFKENNFDNFAYLYFSPRMGIRFYDWNYAECDIIQDDKYISFKNSHIKYVHQLQNLYFALTGKELNIE